MLITRRAVLQSSGVLGAFPLLQSLIATTGYAQQVSTPVTSSVAVPPAHFHTSLAAHLNDGSVKVLQALHSGTGIAEALNDAAGRLRLFSQHIRSTGADDLHRKLMAKTAYKDLDPKWSSLDDHAIAELRKSVPGMQKRDIPSSPAPTPEQFEIAKQAVIGTGLSGHFLNVADVFKRAALHFELESSASLEYPEKASITPAAYYPDSAPQLVRICDAQQKQKTKKAKSKMLCNLVTYLKYASWTGATIRLAVCGADAVISLGLDVATDGAAVLLAAEESALCVALGSAAVKNTNYILTTLGFAVC